MEFPKWRLELELNMLDRTGDNNIELGNDCDVRIVIRKDLENFPNLSWLKWRLMGLVCEPLYNPI